MSSWGSYKVTGNPYASLSAPQAVKAGVPRPPVMTTFAFEGWTIHFQEQEPFSWYVTHNCHPVFGGATDRVYLDNQMEVIDQDPSPDEVTDIQCTLCKKKLLKYTYLILRRTQKFMLFGKRPL